MIGYSFYVFVSNQMKVGEINRLIGMLFICAHPYIERSGMAQSV
jgi:hypothetical protein